MVLMGNSVVSEQNLHMALRVSSLLDHVGPTTQLLCYGYETTKKKATTTLNIFRRDGILFKVLTSTGGLC